MNTATDELPVPSPPAKRKLASRVVDRIIGDIVRDGWPVGTIVGSESELLDRYDVSRAVFREAVRLLEHLGVARTRRGPGGGLVVTRPSTSAVVQAFIVYLTYADVSLDDLMRARSSLERSIAGLAAERADETQLAALRARASTDQERRQLDATDHHVLHTMIAQAAQNPAAELFVDVLGPLTARWSYPTVTPDEQHTALGASARAHYAIVDAITSGDRARAERRMAAHLDALGDWLGRHRQSPRSLEWVLDAEGGDEKLGSQVARSIIVEIADGGWPIGQVIASEPELIERYNVSRSALREAVRLLEYHEVATMKRGPGGGLVVTAPSIEPIVRSATVFLQQRGIRASELMGIRKELESDAVVLAAARATPKDIQQLRLALQADEEAAFENRGAETLHVRIAELTGNQAIALFVRVLFELSRLHASVPGRRSSRRTAINDETDRAHHAIVEALASGDGALARRRLSKHLTAMEPLLR